MKWNRWLLVVGTALTLAACGGGGGSSGTSVFGDQNSSGTGADSGSTTTTSKAKSVDVLSSAATVGSSGTDSVTVTAVIKDASNVALSDTAVSFAVNNGTLTSVSAKTDSSGLATAKFSAGTDRSNRTATVTVTSGQVSGQIQIEITGTKLQVSGVSTLKYGDSGDLVVKATDSSGADISGQTIAVSSSSGNGLSTTSFITNVTGQGTVRLAAVKSGSDTLTFSGLGTLVTASMIVSGEDFVFVSPSASTQVPVNTEQSVQVRYRVNGAGVAGKTIQFSSTAGSFVGGLSSATTDANGLASVRILGASAVPVTVTARVSGNDAAEASLPLSFVATVPSKVILQTSPTAVAPNAAGSTTNQAKVLATVLDANYNPVAGRTVYFSRSADPSGGNLSASYAVTDSNGQASVQFIPGAVSTASDAVKLQATVADTLPAVTSDVASLTVNQSALFIALGTGNVITNLDPQTYQKNWVIYVTDSTGVPVSGVQLTVKALPKAYGKGFWFVPSSSSSSSSSTTTTKWVQYIQECPSEDMNNNGVLDPEDRDGINDDRDGVLYPGNVISVTPGTVKTDSTGRATVSLIYAESYARWVKLELSAEAVVNGTASKTSTVFWAEILADDVNNTNVIPPGQLSPFGQNDCSIPG